MISASQAAFYRHLKALLQVCLCYSSTLESTSLKVFCRPRLLPPINVTFLPTWSADFKFLDIYLCYFTQDTLGTPLRESTGTRIA